MIINIETSGNRCSVALSHEGQVILNLHDDTPLNHARALAPLVKQCTDWIERQDSKADAVAVSIGPGSYTGLRIGLSLAKGLCVGYDIPLIGIPTLKLLAAQACFNKLVQQCICEGGEPIFVPMIDARRMEVYTATYNLSLNELEAPHPLILEPDSLHSLAQSYPGQKIFVVGEGSHKFNGICTTPAVEFLDKIVPDAAAMMPLSEIALLHKNFVDTAYSTPLYVKDFEATKPKNKVLG